MPSVDLDKRRGRARAYYAKNKDRITARQRAYKKKWYSEKKEKHADYMRRWTYGLSAEAFSALVAAQGGACAICGSVPTKSLCVDHCHTTGQVRGLLCFQCNAAIGLLKDSAEALRAAAVYLEGAR